MGQSGLEQPKGTYQIRRGYIDRPVETTLRRKVHHVGDFFLAQNLDDGIGGAKIYGL